MKMDIYKKKEREIIQQLVLLSDYATLEPKKDIIKILNKEVDILKESEDSLVASEIEALGDIGFKKTILTFARKRLETIIRAIAESGERQKELEKELNRVRKAMTEIETGNENRSVLDG